MQRIDTTTERRGRRAIGVVGAISALTALVFSASGAAAVETAASNAHERSAVSGTSVEATPGGQATVSAVQAIRIATAAVDRGKVFDIELDRVRGSLVWELDVASANRSYDVRINARSGKVMSVRRDRTPDSEIRLLSRAKVSAVSAARITSRAVPGATLHGVELDRWRGRVVWKSDLVTGKGVEYDVIIDARTGKLLSREIDD